MYCQWSQACRPEMSTLNGLRNVRPWDSTVEGPQLLTQRSWGLVVLHWIHNWSHQRFLLRPALLLTSQSAVCSRSLGSEKSPKLDTRNDVGQQWPDPVALLNRGPTPWHHTAIAWSSAWVQTSEAFHNRCHQRRCLPPGQPMLQPSRCWRTTVTIAFLSIVSIAYNVSSSVY